MKGIAAGAVGVLIAAGVAGAAAGSFSTEDIPGEPTTTTTEAPAEPTTTTTEAPAEPTTTTEAPAGDPTTTLADGQVSEPEIECAEGNHGKTVSSVAHATPSGPGKGAIVSAAAQSDCGKSDDDTDEVDDDDDDADEVEESSASVDDDDEADDDGDEADDQDDDDGGRPEGAGKGQGKKGRD